MNASDPVTRPVTSLTATRRTAAADARQRGALRAARAPAVSFAGAAPGGGSPRPPNSARAGCPAARLLGLEQPDDQRARGAAAVADRVLLARRQLGHRALVAGVVVRDEGGVVAEAAAAARLVRERALAAAVHDLLAPARLDVGERAHVRHPAVAVGGHLARAAWRGSPRRWRPRRRSGPTRRPGAPPSAAASIPESSAIAGAPGGAPPRRAPCRARCRRRWCRSRAAARTSSGSGSSSYGRISSASSRSLCSLRVARTSRTAQPAAAAATASSWAARSSRDPVGGEREQLVERGARERRALGGGLHLDQAAVAGHHHVRVDLGRGVLGVVEVEQRAAVDDARTRPRRPTGVSGSASSLPSAIERGAAPARAPRSRR